MTNSTEKKVFEIANPSDAYTIVGEYKVAVLAVTFLSEAYGVTDKEGKTTGMFAFGGLDEWMKANEITDIGQYVNSNRQAFIEAFDSVLIGGFADRVEIEAALALIPKEKHEEFLVKRHDRKRSSINDIGKKAKIYAERLRKAELKEQQK